MREHVNDYLHHVSTDLVDILVLLLQRQSTIIIFHFRKQYRSQNVAGTFKIDGKVRILDGSSSDKTPDKIFLFRYVFI